MLKYSSNSLYRNCWLTSLNNDDDVDGETVLVSWLGTSFENHRGEWRNVQTSDCSFVNNNKTPLAFDLTAIIVVIITMHEY